MLAGRGPEYTNDEWSPISYVYHLDQKCGNTDHSCGTGDHFPSNNDGVLWESDPDLRYQMGQWYRIEQRIKMNDPDNDPDQGNGLIEVWIDGKKDPDLCNYELRYTTADTIGINRLWADIHYGGMYQSPAANTLFLDNFHVSTGPTPWSGELVGDSEWSGTIHVDGDVMVDDIIVDGVAEAEEVTLTVTEGTEVRFAAGSDGTGGGSDASRSELIVADGGTLVVSGVAGGEVAFGSASATPSNDDWRGIRVESGGTADLSNVTFRHGSPCLEVDTGGTLTISNTAFSDCGMISGESESSALAFLEDFMDVVDTYTASALIGDSVTWSLVDSGDDDAFVIHPQQGVLRFDPAPDFEALTEAGHDTDSNGNIVLHVRVRAEESENNVSAEYGVTVTVTNVDEPGSVELSSTAPKVGDRLTAELTDPDKGVEGVSWEWQAVPPGTRSTHPPGPGASTASSLLVTSEHIGLTLSAQVTYLDGESNNANDRKSAQSAATAPVVDVPSAPRNLEAAAGNARVELRWDPPLTDNGSALTGYVVRHRSDGGANWMSETLAVTTRHTVRDLTNGTEYSFEVRAVNGAGEGASASDTATPRRPDTRGRVEWSTTQPRVGQELTPTLIDPDNPALAEARWRWRRQRWSRSDAGDSLSAPAPESRSGESKLAVIARTRQYRPRVSDLNQWLRVEVTYTDDYTGDSRRHRVSATASRAVGPGPPCAPANLKAKPGDGQVTLTWEAGCDNGGTIDRYQYHRYQYRRPDAVKWVRVPGDGSAGRQQVTGLTNGEAHTFEVRARNGQGWGPSAQATATPEAERTVSFAAAAYQASEGGEAATVTVRLSRAASYVLSIPIAVNPRSGDFTVAGLTDGGLSFSSGAERQTFTVTATQDGDWDDEEVTLGFGTPLPEGVSAGTTAEAVVRLVDDDDAPGVVTVRPATAQVGTELTATLSDADEVAEVTGWQWHRRASDQAAWTAISGATAAAYTPVSADAGQYLQAAVGYTDGHGPDKSAESAAIGPVARAPEPPVQTDRTVWFGKGSYSATEGGPQPR